MRRVCIVGGDSTIGRALGARLRAQGVVVEGTSRRSETTGATFLDLADPDRWDGPSAVPDVAFLCASITDMARCDADAEGARRVNAEGVVRVANRLADAGARVVLLSTSAVFSGNTAWVAEDAAPDPANTYGTLKAEAEREVIALGERGVVVRLTKVLEASLPLLSGWRARLDDGLIVKPFRDLRMAPVSLDYAVRLLLRIAYRDVCGVFHGSGSADISYADFLAAYALRRGNSPHLVAPVTSAEAGVQLTAQPRHATLGMARATRHLEMAPQPVDAVISDLLGGEPH